MQKKFVFCVYCRSFHSPITVSASKRHEHKPQSKRLHNAGESESKRLQRYARDGKPRGKALSKYA